MNNAPPAARMPAAGTQGIRTGTESPMAGNIKAFALPVSPR